MTTSQADDFKRWAEHPDQFVWEVFKVKPDPWQLEVLQAFPHNQRLAMKACKGPGKTALLAWLSWNFLLTRPYPKMAATSITADNLFDNFWTEMAKWQSVSPLLQRKFTWTKTRIFFNEHPETWWMSARPWSKSADASSQGNTLAGLHADFIMFILDESGGIPDAIMVAADAALASCIEGHILQAGNPTHLEGPLWRACTSERRLWYIVEITADPDSANRTPRVSTEWARQQIEKYGRDNPWVLINVFGQFPPASLNALIGPDEVSAAMNRHYKAPDYERSARVLGIDVARFGDDKSVIFPRQGLQAFNPIIKRNLDGPQGAGLTASKWTEWDADGCFIDDTGGFGATWIDSLRQLGYAPIGVLFNATKGVDQRYYNKRTEMAFKAIEWVKAGGALPQCPELLAAMTQTTYSFKGEKMILEPKDDIKIKLGYSPDEFDAFMLTFAAPMQRNIKMPFIGRNQGNKHLIDYDPFSRQDRGNDGMNQHQYEYDPFNPGRR